MTRNTVDTFWARIYMSGSIEVAKQVCREYCLEVGLCVTIEPTTFIYTGGEEAGFVVGLINYPRFPASEFQIEQRATHLMERLLEVTCQHSALLMMPGNTCWITKREQ